MSVDIAEESCKHPKEIGNEHKGAESVLHV